MAPPAVVFTNTVTFTRADYATVRALLAPVSVLGVTLDTNAEATRDLTDAAEAFIAEFIVGVRGGYVDETLVTALSALLHQAGPS